MADEDAGGDPCRKFADGFPNLFVRDAVHIRNRHVAFLASFQARDCPCMVLHVVLSQDPSLPSNTMGSSNVACNPPTCCPGRRVHLRAAVHHLPAAAHVCRLLHPRAALLPHRHCRAGAGVLACMPATSACRHAATPAVFQPVRGIPLLHAHVIFLDSRAGTGHGSVSLCYNMPNCMRAAYPSPR